MVTRITVFISIGDVTFLQRAGLVEAMFTGRYGEPTKMNGACAVCGRVRCIRVTAGDAGPSFCSGNRCLHPGKEGA